MSKVIPGSSLTAYERWEVPSVDSASAAFDQPELTSATGGQPSTLPTLDEVESIQRLAQEEGFAAGYQEGRKEGKEQGYGKGQQEGYEKGYQQGHQEGLEASRDEIAERAQKLGQILDFMSRPLDELDTTVEQELAHLAIAIARQLMRRELKTAPGEIVAVVRQTLGLLPVASREVRVHLHPEDAELVRDVFALKEESYTWRIQDDPTLTRGGCRVETNTSSIDASVERRLGAVIAKVLGDERKEDGYGP